MQWRYCSLALSHQFVFGNDVMSIVQKFFFSSTSGKISKFHFQFTGGFPSQSARNVENIFLSWHHASDYYIAHVLSQGLSTRNRCSYKVYGHVLNISWLVFFTARLAEHCWWIEWGCWEFLLSHWDLSMLDTGKTQISEIKKSLKFFELASLFMCLTQGYQYSLQQVAWNS